MTFLWLCIGVLLRLFAPLPNTAPLIALCLLAPTVFSKKAAIAIILGIAFISDSLLSWHFGYPAFGSWTFFNGTGWVLITFLGRSHYRKQSILLITSVATIAFWIWTNFGTWCGDYGLYPHTINGLLNCYAAGLPFLRNSLVSNFVFVAVTRTLTCAPVNFNANKRFSQLR